jgi:hypothetical protein
LTADEQLNIGSDLKNHNRGSNVEVNEASASYRKKDSEWLKKRAKL